MLNRLVVPSLFVASLICVAPAQVVIKTPTKDGEVISGSFKLGVIVEAQSLVSQVEFYIDDNLVSTDDSTPYEYTIDTLTRNDGPLTISIAAYSRSGESARLNVKLTVDNGLTLGAAHHIGRAEQFLTEQQWWKAVQACRVALKIEPKNNEARMAISRAYYGAGAFDLAQKFAEDIISEKPEDIKAHELLSAIGLKQAFNAMQYGAGDDRTIQVISKALQSSAKSKNDAFSRQIETFGAVTDGNRLKFIDLLNEAGRYSLVIDELTPIFNKDERVPEIADRLVYSMMMGGRYREALITLRKHSRVTGLDAYGYALLAILEDWSGNEQGSLQAEQEAILSDPSDRGVKTAQAFLALRRGKLQTVESIVQGLSNLDQFGPITNYYLSSLLFIQSKFEPSNTAFQTALLSDPSMYHVYIERFNQSLAYYVMQKAAGQDSKFQLKFARTFAQGALEAKPESFEALTALALISLYDGNVSEAVKLAQAAVSAGPQYAAANYVLSAALMQDRKLDMGMKAMEAAGKLDVKWLRGLKTPTTDEAWRYFYVRGRTPLLEPPGR